MAGQPGRPRRTLTGRARGLLRDLAAGGRFRCLCGEYGSLLAWKAHALSHDVSRWASGKARQVGRKIGKERDRARRFARDVREAAGLADRRGRSTLRALSRPRVRGTGRQAVRALRDADRHHRRHDRAQKREWKADRAAARGRHDRAARHRDKAARLRGYAEIPEGHPARKPAPARVPAPPRVPRSRGGGRTPSPAPPGGRLAPAPPGGRLAPVPPAREGRTR
jgi:hypothetical protein